MTPHLMDVKYVHQNLSILHHMHTDYFTIQVLKFLYIFLKYNNSPLSVSGAI